MTTLATRDLSNQPNSDLKVGEYILITGWCGPRAFIRTVRMGPLVSEAMSPDDSEGAEPNRMLFGDVIRIDAIDYPHAMATVLQSNGKPMLIDLDLKEFDCRRAGPEYLREAMKRNKVRGPLAVRWQAILASSACGLALGSAMAQAMGGHWVLAIAYSGWALSAATTWALLRRK